MNPLSNIKKIRGWKKRIATAERWKARNSRINLEHLARYGYTTAQIRFHPWGNLAPRQPPFWYRRLLLKHLIAIHEQWADILQREYGADFYLSMWLFHPRFHQSQVVAAVGKRMEFYHSVFRSEPGLKTVPPTQYVSADYDLAGFEWQPALDEERYSIEDGDIAADDVGWLLNEGATVERWLGGAETYVVKRGTVWVGQERAG